VAIFVGGSPAMAVAAMMPLPEGLSELTFAGALAGHRIPMIRRRDRPAIYADADFVIEGTIQPGATKPEGPFGDHLGYYARRHEFPLMRVDHVWHREGAIWPVTVVGRPPQEDTLFGWLVHELTGPVIPTVLPGVQSIHAVDASGVHPLLLAVGSERYLPWKPSTRPAELLTQASAFLGQGQLSLAKYLFIVAGDDVRRVCLVDFGFCFQWASLRGALPGLVIAEVNEGMPRTLGHSMFPLSRVAAHIRTNRPLHQHEKSEPTAEERRIGEIIAGLVDDGLQLVANATEQQ
jgi:4-hydroxy-3-polyprenylbenzoate decarboxylase